MFSCSNASMPFWVCCDLQNSREEQKNVKLASIHESGPRASDYCSCHLWKECPGVGSMAKRIVKSAFCLIVSALGFSRWLLFFLLKLFSNHLLTFFCRRKYTLFQLIIAQFRMPSPILSRGCHVLRRLPLAIHL